MWLSSIEDRMQAALPNICLRMHFIHDNNGTPCHLRLCGEVLTDNFWDYAILLHTKKGERPKQGEKQNQGRGFQVHACPAAIVLLCLTILFGCGWFVNDFPVISQWLHLRIEHWKTHHHCKVWHDRASGHGGDNFPFLEQRAENSAIFMSNMTPR